MEQQALQPRERARSALKHGNSVVRKSELLDEGAARGYDVQQRRGHVVVNQPQHSHVAAHAARARVDGAGEHSGDLVVVQAGLSQELEVGDIIRHLRQTMCITL
jgi:hypothetical protein